MRQRSVVSTEFLFETLKKLINLLFYLGFRRSSNICHKYGNAVCHW